MRAFKFVTTILFLPFFFSGTAQNGLKDLLKLPESLPHELIQNQLNYNGYTNHWYNTYDTWYRYGNLFKMKQSDPYLTLLQSKIDMADDIGIPGLMVQEGFFARIMSATYRIIHEPDVEALKKALEKEDVMVTVSSESPLGQELNNLSQSEFEWIQRLTSYQFGASDFTPVKAFRLEAGRHQLFVISSESEIKIRQFLDLIQSTTDLLNRYNLQKGWFGASTLLKSVTIQPGHPLDIISRGMNEGNSWFIFDGYMDFLAQEELRNWASEIGKLVYVDVGFSPIYGCENYEGLQVQDLKTNQSWIDYAKSKHGYTFRPVYSPDADAYEYDGYITNPGNKYQIDHENVPFIHRTGFMMDGMTSSMILFMEKNKNLNRESVWEAILDRKAVAVSAGAQLMGPSEFRHALGLLYLDKEFLEDYFQDQIDIEARCDDYHLKIRLYNSGPEEITGELKPELPGPIKGDQMARKLTLQAGEVHEINLPLTPEAAAMGGTHLINVVFSSAGKEKRTIAKWILPPAISVHQLLYAQESKVDFPVSFHNFQTNETIPVKVSVLNKQNPAQTVFQTNRNIRLKKGEFGEEIFQLKIPAGDYIVRTEALGALADSQLGVGKSEGKPMVYEMDLNSDGVPEYRMENDSVLVTLLSTGARVIEYQVKSRNNSNVLFKAWPDKTYNHKAPYRFRGYYPYGGFEDFLGQGSMETHKIYDAEITHEEGDFVQVRMTADYYGNHLEKIFTLYGNSPLLEVRYKLTFHTEDANVIGPQPILELGETHGTEDVFIVPVKEGLREYRMRPEDYYGQAIHVTEGWNAGYDTREDISFVGAFPVDQPIFLHMWMNHPKNTEAPHYYVEFQPWTPIIQNTNMYFTYYLWGAGGDWSEQLNQMKKKNLITESSSY